MGIFRELTPQENQRVSNILEAQHSIEAASKLSFADTSIALAAARAVHIIKSETPSPFPERRQIQPYDFANPHTIPGAALRAAVGNALVVDNDKPFETSGDLAKCIVSDIYVQAEDQTIVKAIDDKNYATGVGERLESIANYARTLEESGDQIRSPIRDVANGIYYKMNEGGKTEAYANEADQTEIYAALKGTKLSDGIHGKLNRFNGSEDYRYEMKLYSEEMLKLDTSDNEQRVTGYLITGTSTGIPAVDQTLRAVHDQVGNNYMHTDPDAHDVHFNRQIKAGARLLTLHEQVSYVTPDIAAAFVLNDIGIMTKAHNELAQGGHVENREQWQMIAAGQYDKLDAAGADVITKAMRSPRHIRAHDGVAVFDSILKVDEKHHSRMRESSQQAAQAQARQLASGMAR